MKHSGAEPELSRPLQVDRIPAGGVEEKIVASPDERKALAARFGLVDLPKLEANLNVDHAQSKMLAVTGALFADVVQTCVVTLEPVPDQIVDSIDVLFAPPHMIENDRDGALADLGQAEPPEPIENGVIDLGELVAQHLALALNPYPRKEGASLGVYEAKGRAKPQPAKENPFAKLAVLNGKKESQ